MKLTHSATALTGLALTAALLTGCTPEDGAGSPPAPATTVGNPNPQPSETDDCELDDVFEGDWSEDCSGEEQAEDEGHGSDEEQAEDEGHGSKKTPPKKSGKDGKPSKSGRR